MEVDIFIQEAPGINNPIYLSPATCCTIRKVQQEREQQRQKGFLTGRKFSSFNATPFKSFVISGQVCTMEQLQNDFPLIYVL